jgi:Uma2 family endonuclease
MATAHAPAPPGIPSVEPTIIPPPGRPWTEDDLLTLDNDDQHRYELVRGELRQMSPSSFTHGGYEIRLLVALAKYLEKHPEMGEIRPGDTGFRLQTEPLTVRVPDVSFVAAERIPTDDTPAFLALAPDLVVEIISPSETAKSMAEKVSDYLGAGTRLLWLVYPEQQEVQEYRPDAPFHIYRIDEELDGREVLPGFRYALRALFA